jgi:hypothetical protein
MTIDLGAGNLYSISNKLLAMKPPNGEYPTPLRSPALPSSRSIFGARDERRTDVLAARTVAGGARERNAAQVSFRVTYYFVFLGSKE